MSANGGQVDEDSQWTNWLVAQQWQHQQHQQWQQQQWISEEDEEARLNWYAATALSRIQSSAASLENSGMPANDQHCFGPSDVQLENARQTAAFANAVSVPPAPRARTSRRRCARAKARAKAKASGKAASSPKAKAKSSPEAKANSSSDDEAALPPTPTQRSQPSAASSSSDSSQPAAALRSISALEQQQILHITIQNERNDMTPAPRFTECDAAPALCGSRVYPNYVLRKLLAGGIDAEPAPCGTDVVSTLVGLDDGAENEPAVGGMSLQSQPMPGSHPLLGQRPLPVPAVWPALEALSEDTQLIIMKFAYSGDFVIQAEEQRYLKQTLSTLKLALLDGDSIELLPPHIIDWYNIYDQTYAAPALGGALAWLGAEDEVEPAVGGADADEAEPALGGADVEPALNIDVDFGGRVYDERAQFIRHRWFRLATQTVRMRHHASFIAWKREVVAMKQRQAACMRRWAFVFAQMLIRRATRIADSTKRQLAFTRYQ